jgi:hypothetical protein
MSARRPVTVSVGALVFEGLSRPAALRAGAALQGALAELIERRGLPTAADVLRAGKPAPLRDGLRPEELGREVAQRVWRELAR